MMCVPRWSPVWFALVFAAAACGSDGDSRPGDEPPADLAAIPDETAPLPAESLPMPGYPAQEGGRLVAVSAGVYDLQGSWPARAARCVDPPMLEVHGLVPGQPGVGTLLLLQMPPDDPLGSYPIVTVEQGAPEPPAAQIAVQDTRTPTAHAFQGLEGMIELYGFGERVSGRFAVTLRELQSDDRAKYAGVFHGVSLEDLPAEYCRQYREGMASPDSG